MRSERADGSQRAPAWLVAGAVACALFVLVAVALEVLGGVAANSGVPDWAAAVAPVAWPPVLRVGWWLLVAAAAGAYRLLLARAGVPQSRWVTVASVAPFVVFATGIAAGAEWATGTGPTGAQKPPHGTILVWGR